MGVEIRFEDGPAKPKTNGLTRSGFTPRQPVEKYVEPKEEVQPKESKWMKKISLHVMIFIAIVFYHMETDRKINKLRAEINASQVEAERINDWNARQAAHHANSRR